MICRFMTFDEAGACADHYELINFIKTTGITTL